MDKKETPQWLLTSEKREPLRDGGAFLRKSAKGLLGVLKSVRREPTPPGRFAFSPPMRLALAFFSILLVSASFNFVFVEIVGTVILVYLATLDARVLARILALPFEAFVASLLILAPAAILWDQTRALVVVPCKTLITTTILSLLIRSMNWNRLTCAFKFFRAPDALIFIFDLTMKYVVVLCEICLETIEAVLLRSPGRDRRRARTLGGVVGVIFLRAQRAAQEQFDAMTCRCFSGVYRRYWAPWRRVDFLGVALLSAMILLFIYFEYAKRCLT